MLPSSNGAGSGGYEKDSLHDSHNFGNEEEP